MKIANLGLSDEAKKNLLEKNRVFLYKIYKNVWADICSFCIK